MAKFSSKAFKAPKLGGASKVKRKTGLIKNAKASRKSIYGAKGGAIKGKNILKGTGKKIGPIRPDLKQGGIKKINRLVETRVQNLVPKISQKIEAKVDSFDPSKFMGKIFDGGLDSLRGFGSSLDGMKGSLQSTVDFLGKATELANKFVDKLGKVKSKKGGGGFFGTLLKGLAVAGVAALAVPAIAKVALFGGAVNAGKNLWKKGTDFISGIFKKKKKDKKKKETKVKKMRKNLFKGVLEKFHSTLDFINPLKRSMKRGVEVEEREDKSRFFHNKTTDGVLGGNQRDEFAVYDTAKSDQIFTLKIDSKNGVVLNGNELQQQIRTKQGQITAKKFENKGLKTENEWHEDGRYDDEIAKNEQDIARLKEEIKELIMTEGSGATSEKRIKTGDETPTVEGIVQKGEEGEKGVEGKKGGLGSFIQNTTQNVKNVAGGIVKSSPTFKLAKMVQENRKAIKSQRQGGAKGMFNQLPQVKMAKWLGGKAKGIAGGIWGGIKGLFSDKEKGMKKEDSQKIAQPATQGKSGGGGGVVPVKVPAAKNDGKPPKQKQTQKEMTTPSNVIPALLAIDAQNMHTPYAKSTFNIVDAL